MSCKPSQNQRILNLLADGKELTPAEALSFFGCFRLAARVHDLRKDGHVILARKVKTAGGASVCAYRLGP